MSNKARIYTLAKEWEVSNEEVIKILNEGGIKVTSSLASVEREIAENIHLETLEKDESKSEEKKPKEKKPKEKKPKEKKPKEKKPKEK
ncbi:MAG: translation initiation factor IF-2 N-terminal domain-containing protein, partial [Verrucomicrobiota bacterium]|nr:translation initiation factor IF-2 N-terminal domain-containing protein [Verrucomicrobiota bacterium]